MIPSDQLQAAEDRLAELELQDIPAQQTLDVVNQALDEFATDPKSMGEPVIIGERRTAIDMAFGHETVEEIVKELTKIASGEVLPSQHKWAQSTLDTLCDLSLLPLLSGICRSHVFNVGICVALPAARLA